MNKVILIGRLTAEPEIRYTQSGKCVASYRLAVDRPFKSDGQPDADFISCVAWDKTGEFCKKYLRNGTKVAVEGRIQTRSYENNDGKKVYVTEVIAERHEFCERKSSGQATETAEENAETGQTFTELDDDGDWPF